jgi:hypothetical protein
MKSTPEIHADALFLTGVSQDINGSSHELFAKGVEERRLHFCKKAKTNARQWNRNTESTSPPENQTFAIHSVGTICHVDPLFNANALAVPHCLWIRHTHYET